MSININDIKITFLSFNLKNSKYVFMSTNKAKIYYFMNCGI